MSLNRTTLSPARTPIPLQDEIEIRNVADVDYVLTFPDSKKIEGRGKIFLTDLRLIVVAEPPSDSFETLSVQHTSLLSIKSEAPRLFNAPRILVEVKPTPGGGLNESGSTRVELRCSKGDKEAFLRFAAGLDKTRERAVNKSRANPEDEFDLPAYGAPGASGSSSSSAPTYATDVPSDAPPGYEP
ncbi:hypothetical protein C8Q80DRAFT_1125179 [Daedaleopsis nitida]|nr:hypothetical protein C8Q80DRAFT_1125179 [Daedaleopsis nitida]